MIELRNKKKKRKDFSFHPRVQTCVSENPAEPLTFPIVKQLAVLALSEEAGAPGKSAAVLLAKTRRHLHLPAPLEEAFLPSGLRTVIRSAEGQETYSFLFNSNPFSSTDF